MKVSNVSPSTQSIFDDRHPFSPHVHAGWNVLEGYCVFGAVASKVLLNFQVTLSLIGNTAQKALHGPIAVVTFKLIDAGEIADNGNRKSPRIAIGGCRNQILIREALARIDDGLTIFQQTWPAHKQPDRLTDLYPKLQSGKTGGGTARDFKSDAPFNLKPDALMIYTLLNEPMKRNCRPPLRRPLWRGINLSYWQRVARVEPN